MSVKIDGNGPITGQTTYPAEMRNVLINGNFKVNQLALSGTVTLGAGAYGHDGWKAGAGGCTYTFATSGRDVTITISAGTLLQIADPDEVEAGNYIASWAGTAQARINGGAYGATGVAVTGIAAGAALNVEFNAGTVGRAQLEYGDTATVYERRRLSVEMALCQQYFCKSHRQSVAPGANTGIDGGGEDGGLASNAVPTSLAHRVLFPVSMKSPTPTIVTYDANGLSNAANYITSFTAAGSQNNNQPSTIDNKSERGFKIFTTTNNPSRVFFHWTASARL
jgi:hypothetical protein